MYTVNTGPATGDWTLPGIVLFPRHDSDEKVQIRQIVLVYLAFDLQKRRNLLNGAPNFGPQLNQNLFDGTPSTVSCRAVTPVLIKVLEMC
jgi:hypothetical protein